MQRRRGEWLHAAKPVQLLTQWISVWNWELWNSVE